MADADKPHESTRPAHWFGTTQWTDLMAAQRTGSPEARAALERLCQTYWYPLYAYVRRRGYSAQDAEDLTQAFFLELIEKNYLGAVDRRKGKFRSFLLAAMNHFLANEYDWRTAAKRGGGRTFISIDDEETWERKYQSEAATEQSPEKIFEARWAATVIEQARLRLRETYAAEGKAELFDALERFLSESPGQAGYAEVAAALNMTPGAVATAVHRLRQRYGEAVREEVARTVARPEEIEDEMRHLREVLGELPG